MTCVTKESMIQDWLCGVTYKPGWSVEYVGQLRDGVAIVVRATEPDVCNPGEIFSTSLSFTVPENITRERFYDWIIDVCIPGIEAHERWEWFRIDGEHWRDPHASGMPAFATDLISHDEVMAHFGYSDADLDSASVD